MRIQSVVSSFGYLHGDAPRATLTLDTRVLLRDPHIEPRLRQLDGFNMEVRKRVADTPGTHTFVASVVAAVRGLLAAAGDPQGLRVDVAVGCAGGRHRSVVLANLIADGLEAAGVGVELVHRDVNRAVVRR